MKTAVLSVWCMSGGEDSCFSIKDCDRSKYKMRITSEKVLQVRKRVSKKAGQSKPILLVLTLLFVRLLKLKARLVFFLLFRLRCISNRVDDGCHEERADHIDHGVLL